MIKAKNGKCVLKGKMIELVNEYRAVTETMVQMFEKNNLPKESSKYILIDIVENEFLKGEEIHEKLIKKIKKMKDSFKNLFEEEKDGADNE